MQRKLKTLAFILSLAIFPWISHAGKVSSNCKAKGIKLAGKVQIVNSFPDIKVKEVRSFPDLKVKKVSSFAKNCGEWQFVTSFPDFKVQFVNSFEDVSIQYVTSFPGVN